MFLWILSALVVIIPLIVIFASKKENWSWTTFSGEPGPIESPFRSNVPALYGDPKYESPCHYDFGKSKGPYIQKNQYPCANPPCL